MLTHVQVDFNNLLVNVVIHIHKCFRSIFMI